MRLPFRSALLALGLLGCGGAGRADPDESLVEGSWVGVTTGDAQEGVLQWSLQDSDGDISGSGSLSTVNDAVEFTINGSYSPPGVTLTIHPDGFEDISFAGTVGEETMKGRLNGAGFLNRTVTLERQ